MSNLEKVRKIIHIAKQKPYSKKEEWEKFLDKESRETRRRLKEQRENEVLTDGNWFEYKKFN